MSIKHNPQQHADFDLSTIDIRLKSTPNYVKYLKHLAAAQKAQGEMNTYNVLQMVVRDLEEVIIENKKKIKL